jgi:hypothetical protein
MYDMEANDYEHNENILRKMINSLILPKYSDVNGIRKIYSDSDRGIRRYTVVLDMERILGNSDDIVREIETLFKMASLNSEDSEGRRDYIRVFRKMD